MGRIANQKSTIRLMIGMYCSANHRDKASTYHGDKLCGDCGRLLEYALTRLDRCPHGESKPSCRQCKIHCYRSAEREEMRSVMRYAGPRMMFTHPIAAVRHIISELPRRNK